MENGKNNNGKYEVEFYLHMNNGMLFLAVLFSTVFY